MRNKMQASTQAAVEAYRRGFTPVPVVTGGKRPYGHAWQNLRWDSEDQVAASFEGYAHDDKGNVGLILGEASGNLLDVDLDHPKAVRMRNFFLPKTDMKTGRTGRPGTHYWYRATENLPTNTRQYRMPDGSVSVELRSNGSQTVIPPSTHVSGERYLWEGEEWADPAEVNGGKLAVQVALLGLGAVLLEAWPSRGGRHDAYLMLAGGLLRFGDGVHLYWSRNLPHLIGALAEATGDEDGPETRIHEVMETTSKRLDAEGGRAVGFPRLAELIGNDPTEMVRRLARDIESLAGFDGREEIKRKASTTSPPPPSPSQDAVEEDVPDWDQPIPSTLPPEQRNPLEERVNTWASVDLGPYLAGDLKLPDPTLLQRTDGKSLIYPNRVNSLYGKSESGKTWVAMLTAIQEIGRGGRVLFIDLEDDPIGVIDRFTRMGSGADDLRHQLRYVRPEGPNSDMQRGRFGREASTDLGEQGRDAFSALLKEYDPSLIIVDGMTALYGLHGLDTNDAASTDVITTWLKQTCRNGKSTVLVIDHTGKSGGTGSSPIGAHHKIAMVQGVALRVDVIDRPMKGALGHLQLLIYKDRIGTVRGMAREERPSSSSDDEQLAGEVWVDSRHGERTEVRVDPPDGHTAVLGRSDESAATLTRLAEDEELRDRMVSLFGGDLDFPLSTSDVIHLLNLTDGGNDSKDRKRVREAWGMLAMQGVVKKYGNAASTHYRLRRPPEPIEDEDDTTP